MDGSETVSSTKRVVGLESVSGQCEGTVDTTISVQMEEENRAIQTMTFVTKLSRVVVLNSHGDEFRVSLTCLKGFNLPNHRWEDYKDTRWCPR